MWYEIPNISDVYRVNKKGEFINTGTNKRLYGELMNRGYIRMHLKDKEGNGVRIMAHRLVALTFLGEPPTLEYQVNHINSNPSDNRVENLEWATGQENINHKMKNMCPKQYEKQQQLMSKVGKQYGYINGKKSAKPVARINPETKEVLETYVSARDASRKNSEFNYKGISKVCNGDRHTYKGYIWRFIE